jgi:hypothetical protein
MVRQVGQAHGHQQEFDQELITRSSIVHQALIRGFLAYLIYVIG